MLTKDAPATPPGGRVGRWARRLIEVVHDINAAQQAMFENDLRFDQYLWQQPDDDYLHWEPAMPGWRLSGTYLPPCEDGTAPPCHV